MYPQFTETAISGKRTWILYEDFHSKGAITSSLSRFNIVLLSMILGQCGCFYELGVLQKEL